MRRYAAHIGLAVVIREQHFRLDHPRRVDELSDRHGVRLVTGQKSDVNVLDFSHFWNVLGVSGNVDSQPVEGEDEAVIPSLGVELLVSFRGVVSGNSLDGEVVGYLKAVAVGHHRASAKHLGAALVGNDLCFVARKQFDSRCVKMVEMFVGDKDVIRFGHCGVVDGFLPQFRHGVNLNLLAVVFDTHGGMDKRVDFDRLAILGGEVVDFVRNVLATSGSHSHKGNYAGD